MCPRHLCTEGNILVDLRVNGCTGSDTLVLCVDNNTLVAQETYRSIVLGLLITARSRDVVVLTPCGTGHLILPVGIFTLTVICSCPDGVPHESLTCCGIYLVVVDTSLTEVGGILVTTAYIKLRTAGLDTEVSCNINIGLTL